MTRRWKDNENIKIKHSRLYLIGAGFLIVMSSLNFIVPWFHWNWQDFLNIGLGVFLIWGVKFNGLYKIARYLTERRLKRRDNKFDYFHT